MGGGALLRSVSAGSLSFAGLAGLMGELIVAAPCVEAALSRFEMRSLKK